jgi:hypothetical protein
MRDVPEICDKLQLTDADWAEINHLNRVYKNGGPKAFSKALGELGEKDPMQFFAIAFAYFPVLVREVIKNNVANLGMTADDFRSFLATSEDPTTVH